MGDKGGLFKTAHSVKSEDTFTTFLTSRIACDKIYTILIDVILVNKQILIGIFKTSESSLPGSAICLFDLSDIRKVFKAGRGKGDSQLYKRAESCLVDEIKSENWKKEHLLTMINKDWHN